MVQNKLLRYITGATAVEIAAGIEAAVVAGALVPGERLPTVRDLAASLGVSPTTVSLAFAELKRRGLLVTQGRRGSAISQGPPLAMTPASPKLPKGVLDLSLGNPDPDLLPDFAPALSVMQPRKRLYESDAADPELLRLARRGFEADGIAAEHLSVTGGALDGMQRALAAHLRPGDRVAVEDPGFPSVFYMLAALGLGAVPVSIDESGPDPASLARVLRDGVQALIVTPRAQNPSGAAIDEGRACELRALLDRYPDVFLLEDDHAGIVAGVGAVSLCSPARKRFAVVRSVSKAYGPDLRLATMASDDLTRVRVEGRQVVSMRWVSFILQRLVVSLWTDRAVRQQVRTARRSYTQRRRGLLAALESRGISGWGRSGLNVWIPVPDETAAHLGLRSRGFEVSRGERFRLTSRPAIRVSVGPLREPEVIERFAAALQSVLSEPEGVPAV